MAVVITVVLANGTQVASGLGLLAASTNAPDPARKLLEDAQSPLCGLCPGPPFAALVPQAADLLAKCSNVLVLLGRQKPPELRCLFRLAIQISLESPDHGTKVHV
jgi:hypothetical protein